VVWLETQKIQNFHHSVKITINGRIREEIDNLWRFRHTYKMSGFLGA